MVTDCTVAQLNWPVLKLHKGVIPSKEQEIK